MNRAAGGIWAPNAIPSLRRPGPMSGIEAVPSSFSGVLQQADTRFLIVPEHEKSPTWMMLMRNQ